MDLIDAANERESVKVLRECVDLQNKKGADYQSKASPVRQADYYTNGVTTIHDIMHAKMLRMLSLQHKAASGDEPNFEGLEDTAKDLINYASFYVAWLRGKIDGQDEMVDIFNRPVVSKNPLVAKAAEYISDPQSLALQVTQNTQPKPEDNFKYGPVGRISSDPRPDHSERGWQPK